MVRLDRLQRRTRDASVACSDTLDKVSGRPRPGVSHGGDASPTAGPVTMGRRFCLSSLADSEPTARTVHSRRVFPPVVFLGALPAAAAAAPPPGPRLGAA